MVRFSGVAVVGAIAVVLGGCTLISGVNELHPAGSGPTDAAGPPALDGSTPSITPGNDGGAPIGDGGEPGDVDAAGFQAMGAGDAAQGRPGFDAVVGSQLMTSASYKLVVTTGEAPGGNGVSVSSGHRLIGGVVGTTQQ